MWRGFRERWIDVYENDGKRSGAYSAPVYGVHPYMLLNWADTLDDVFTLAHEMGHSMHTMLSHERQPFVYSDYTIFVAEVPSTLTEALLLEHLLAHDDRPRRADRAAAARDRQHHEHVLHAGAVRRFRAGGAHARRAGRADHGRRAERALQERFDAYYGDSVDMEELTPITWARIPHFFNSPYYVYQYATCFASAAKLARPDHEGSPASRAEARARYLDLLGGGRQRPSDDAAQEGGRRSERAVDDPGGHRSAGQARRTAGRTDLTSTTRR